MTGHAAAQELMTAFVARTGVSEPVSPPVRYLWTDALAVCTLLGLHSCQRETPYLAWAQRLAEQVHHVLGRHRLDDGRAGWISGLAEEEGELHPTRGGLRIGKRLNERSPAAPLDEHLEWERDGQYFHYLTRWMRALARLHAVTGEQRYLLWALELGDVAQRAFIHVPPGGGTKRMYWKMSIDLSRPLVTAMGQHDPLDGLATFSLLQAARTEAAPAAAPDLSGAVADFRDMCSGRRWTTGDELGIGGMLVAAHTLVTIAAGGGPAHPALAHDVLADAEESLVFYARHHRLHDGPPRRLAFRELGLSIGLHTLGVMHEKVRRRAGRFDGGDRLLERLDALERFRPLAQTIERSWCDTAHRNAPTWLAHEDINAVMLATSLAPAGYLFDVPGPGRNPPVAVVASER